MATEPRVTTPQKGDRVSAAQHEGVFEVVGVNSLMQTVNIRSVDGKGSVIPNVPWTALSFVGKK